MNETTSNIVGFALKLHNVGKQMMKHGLLCTFGSMIYVTTNGAPKWVAISSDKERLYYYPPRLRLAG